jgi:hypothetical protein
LEPLLHLLTGLLLQLLVNDLLIEAVEALMHGLTFTCRGKLGLNNYP